MVVAMSTERRKWINVGQSMKTSSYMMNKVWGSNVQLGGCSE